MASKFRILKYDGDDKYSYAIFYAKHVAGMSSPVMYGEATPIGSGMTLTQARTSKKRLDKNNS